MPEKNPGCLAGILRREPEWYFSIFSDFCIFHFLKGTAVRTGQYNGCPLVHSQ
jgi:hypothetical protein